MLPEVPSKLCVEKYKEKLDEYLWHIPDQPGSVEDDSRLVDTNSLLHQTQYYQEVSLRPRRNRDANAEEDEEELEEVEWEEIDFDLWLMW